MFKDTITPSDLSTLNASTPFRLEPGWFRQARICLRSLRAGKEYWTFRAMAAADHRVQRRRDSGGGHSFGVFLNDQFEGDDAWEQYLAALEVLPQAGGPTKDSEARFLELTSSP